MIVLFVPIFNAGLSVSLSQAPPCMASLPFSLLHGTVISYFWILFPLFFFFFFFLLHMNLPAYHLTFFVFAFAFGESFSPSWTPNSLPTLLSSDKKQLVLVFDWFSSAKYLEEKREEEKVSMFDHFHWFICSMLVISSAWTRSPVHTKRLLSSQCSPLFQYQIAPTLRQTVMA